MKYVIYVVKLRANLNLIPFFTFLLTTNVWDTRSQKKNKQPKNQKNLRFFFITAVGPVNTFFFFKLAGGNIRHLRAAGNR